MLKMMRTNAKYFYILFVVVILSFIFWGIGPSGNEDRNVLAEVGSYTITAQEYWQTYDNISNFYRQLYKDKFDEDMRKKLNLKQNVLNALINDKLLLIAAHENGIRVSNKELNRAIESEPAFMTDGAFDVNVYQNRLRLQSLTPQMYEASKRQELTIQKMQRLIALSVSVPPEDLAKVPADDKNAKAMKDALMTNAQQSAVQSYIDGLKKQVKIKVYEDRLG